MTDASFQSLAARRGFLKSVSAAGAAVLGSQLMAPRALAALPMDDPAAPHKQPWTADLAWRRVVDVTQFAGDDWDRRFAAARDLLSQMGGGVIYFPPGTYTFRDHIALTQGVIIRGAAPKVVTDARQARYQLQTVFQFPKYEPILEDDGAPISSAFKGIRVLNPATDGDCGVVHIEILNGHIHLDDAAEKHDAGANRLVVGCILRDAAGIETAVPNLEIGQKPWQRFTNRHFAAIDVKASKNLLIAGNRLPKSGHSNFVMDGFVLKPARGQKPVYDGVVFDYDNRPAMSINHYGIGGAGGSGGDGTPQSHPWGFRQGIVIARNYIYNTGRMGIGFCGDGVICEDNVIRFEKDVWRPTNTGQHKTFGSSTNDNRAIEMRGWRWTVRGNDYEVYRNWAADRGYLINDGEGLMHEDHVNSIIKASVLENNRGNSYLSLYKTGGVEGLRIEGNDISTPGKIADIYVNANRNSGKHRCEDVTIVNNTTRSNGIYIAGHPASRNVIQGNEHKSSAAGVIHNDARAKVQGNRNYQ